MIFSVEHGSFAYQKNERQILRDISFQAEPGDLLAILGPNGAGKTTLLRCAMGLLRWGSGQSSLDGRNIAHMPASELWQKIAYVPQARSVVSPYRTEEMILLGRSSRIGVFSAPKAEDIARTDAVMARLDIEKLKGKRCSEISGGELQMVLIARALVAEPDILILDEPESNLDFKNQLLIMETMSELAASGMSCIFNTHYPAHAMQRANKALLLGADGEYLFGDVASILTEGNIEHAFGVKAVIGEIETPLNITHDVIPVMLSEGGTSLKTAAEETENSLAILSIIAEGAGMEKQLNAILHEYGRHIIGRMGMPYPEEGIYLININLDAPEHLIRRLAQRLGVLPGVSVKTTYARKTYAKGGVK